jgi:undecaprenyl-diphosphatase
MTVLQAIILGIVQGVTEFVPISSSGHLIIVPWAFGWTFFLDHPDLNKTFDVALHLGTFVAVLAFFWRDVLRLLAAFFRSLAKRRAETADERLAWLLLVSTIPAAVVGVAFENFIEERLGKPLLIALLIIAFGVVMWVVDMRARQTRTITGLRWLDALLIGLAQAVALAPGVSRSGVTMITARALSVDRESCARYSFLMSIPVIGGAALYKALEVAQTGLPPGTARPFLWGTVSAAVSGFVAVWFMLAYLRRHDFRPFAIYRFVLGAAIIVAIVVGLRHAGGI